MEKLIYISETQNFISGQNKKSKHHFIQNL